MNEVFLQLNIAICIGWLVFQFLPLQKVNFRSRTTVARGLILSSLLSVGLFALLPDSLFPDLFPKVLIEIARDVDSATMDSVESIPIVANQGLSNTRLVKDNFSFLKLWRWIVLLGFLYMVIRLLSSWYQLSGVLRSSITLHKIGKTCVTVSDSISVPFSTHFLGKAFVVLPSILVPHQMEFRIALRHEIEHHRKGDTKWTLLLEFLVCAFYLNPFAYLWRRTISQLQELACDESLISQMGISEHDYGSCLLKVAEMALGNRKMYAGTTCMIPNSKSEDHSFLIRRIKMFKHHEQASIKKWQGLALGTILSTLIFGGVYIAHATVRSSSAPNPGIPVFDQQIQSETEGILSRGMEKFEASAGFAIVSDPQTGTILASANINQGFDESLSENWAIRFPMQPASAIKPLLVASALQADVTKIDEMQECGNGAYNVGNKTFRDYRPFPKLSTKDTIALSSNICTIKIGEKLGARGIYDGLTAFGIGKGGAVKSFPGASSGDVPFSNETDKKMFIANMAIGSSRSDNFYITPIELVQAYGAIANGGKLMKAIDTSGNQKPEVIRNVLSQKTALDLQGALRQVVTSGTAKWSLKNSPIAMAGKTSTANIESNRRVTGFVGYAPADNPKLVAYVVLFDLKDRKSTGSNTAAPVFKNVMEAALSKYNP